MGQDAKETKIFLTKNKMNTEIHKRKKERYNFVQF